ncbi:hypothetical protein GF312_17075 [Candidatus Poribacteria bacterium]|nr:hypothetical protein [Candidatus Poribacteria bacterium]
MYENMGVAIIGCGGIAHAHCNTVLAKDDTIQLYMYDVDLEKAESMCQQYSGAGIFDTYQEVLSSEKVDVVDICVPHDFHVPVTIAAARAGKHILLEKPIARTLREADQILKAVGDSGVRLFVAECWHFYPSAVKSRELIDQGVIGVPFLIQANSLQYHTPPEWRAVKDKMGGGVLIDRGIHFINYLRMLGGKVESVSATFNHQTIHSMEGEDTASLLLKFQNGVTGQLTVSWATRTAMNWPWLAVYGSEGNMYDTGDGFYVQSFINERYNDKGKPVRLFDTMLEDYTIPAEMEHFVECMRSGEKFKVTGLDARADLEVVEAGHRSVETGKFIYL